MSGILYSTTNRIGYRKYKSDPNRCRDCYALKQCTRSRNHQKVMTRHVWEADREALDANRLTNWGKQVYERRRETMERSFADAKQLHGHRYARYRGLHRVSGRSLLAAACQNIKKIARLRAAFLRLIRSLSGAWERASGSLRPLQQVGLPMSA